MQSLRNRESGSVLPALFEMDSAIQYFLWNFFNRLLTSH